MICKTGLKNMVRPMLMVKGCMVQCWMQQRPLIELTTEIIQRNDKKKKPHFRYHKKNRESCKLYRDTNRVTSIAIHRCIDESCRH